MGFFGFRKSSGKHAAPKGQVPVPRTSTEGAGHLPEHASNIPRATGPYAEQESTESEPSEAAEGSERQAA
jgi:hypothetical protein